MFKPCRVPAVVSRIVVVGVLICYALIHFVCYLKAAQMNEQNSLTWKLKLCECQLSHNIVEATKTIVVRKVKWQLIIVQ